MLSSIPTVSGRRQNDPSYSHSSATAVRSPNSSIPIPTSASSNRCRLCHICGILIAKASLPAHQRQCLRANVRTPRSVDSGCGGERFQLPTLAYPRTVMGSTRTCDPRVGRSGGKNGETEGGNASGHPCTHCMQAIPHEKLASHLRVCKGLTASSSASSTSSSTRSIGSVYSGDRFHRTMSYTESESPSSEPAYNELTEVKRGQSSRHRIRESEHPEQKPHHAHRAPLPSQRANGKEPPIWLTSDAGNYTEYRQVEELYVVEESTRPTTVRRRSVQSIGFLDTEKKEREDLDDIGETRFVSHSTPSRSERSVIRTDDEPLETTKREKDDASARQKHAFDTNSEYEFVSNRPRSVRRSVQPVPTKPPVRNLEHAVKQDVQYRSHAPSSVNDPIRHHDESASPPTKQPIAAPLTTYSGTEFYEYAVSTSSDALPEEEIVRLPCDACGRKFREDILERHVKSCAKSVAGKRKVFNATQARVKGTELEKYVREAGIKLPNASAEAEKLLKKAKEAGRIDKDNIEGKGESLPKNPSWKTKHDSFIRMVRNARAPPGKATYLPADENPDYVGCETCGRRFNALAAERHIPHCKQSAQKKAMLNKPSIPHRKAVVSEENNKADAGPKRRTGLKPPSVVVGGKRGKGSKKKNEIGNPWCSGCGTRYGMAAKFCSGCGAKKECN